MKAPERRVNTEVCELARYWQDPEVLSKLSKAMGPALGGEYVEGEADGDEEELEEDEDAPAETVFEAATGGTSRFAGLVMK